MQSTCNKIKPVLFLAHSSLQGGAEYCLDTTLEHIDRSVISPIVVFPADGPMAESAKSRGILTHIEPMVHWMLFEKSLWYFKELATKSIPSILRLKKLVRKYDVGAVYTNTATLFQGAIAARLTGIPHVWHVHEVLQPPTDMHHVLPISWIKRFIERYSDVVVFESDAAREVFDPRRARTEVVHNSLRIPMPDEIPHRPNPRIHLGVVGRFSERKNPLAVFDAWERLSDPTSIEVTFVGEGPLRQQLEFRRKALGVLDNCHILPFTDDVGSIMGELDALILPSREESFGLVLIEAAAFGLPSIATESEGPCEIILNGKTGIITPQNDPEELANAICSLRDAPDYRLRLGQAARNRVKTMYCPSRNTQQLQQIIASAGQET